MFFDDITRWRNWQPLQEMRRLQHELNELLERQGPAFRQAIYPPMNVWGDEEKLVVTAEMPGVKQENLDVAIVHDTLTIKASRDAEELAEGELYHRQERPAGQFVRTIELPYAVNPDKVKATYAAGLLTLELPRAEADKPKRITVKTA